MNFVKTIVNSTSDPMKASPKTRKPKTRDPAAGFPPSAPPPAPATLDCPSAASPAANAIAKAAASGTQLVPATAPVVPCANAGTAITDAIIIMNINIPNFRIVFLLNMNYRQWVVDAVLYSRRPHAEGRCQTPSVRHQVSGRRKIAVEFLRSDT